MENAARRLDTRFHRANARRRAIEAELVRIGAAKDDVEHLVRGWIAELSGGQTSSTALDDRGWARLLSRMEDHLHNLQSGVAEPRAESAPARRRQPGNPDALSTDRQRMICETLRQLNDMSADDFRQFCLKLSDSPKFKRRFDRPVTRGELNAVIDALKPMALRRHQVLARVCRALESAPLDPQDRLMLRDVAQRYGRGKQGANVRVGSIPVVLKILGRYGVGLEVPR